MFGGKTAYNKGMAGAKAQFKDAYKKVRGTFSYLSAKKYTTLAGTMAFFLVLSIVPFLFWLTFTRLWKMKT